MQFSSMVVPSKKVVSIIGVPERENSPPQTLERKLSHTPEEWARIRPRFKHLYATLDMTLKECMDKIEEEYSFYAR
jgi:hypothetical protein